MRTAIIVAFTLVMTLAALGGAFLVADPIECIEDRIFQATAVFNNFFATHETAKFSFMIICGLMMDTMVLAQFYRFSMFGTSWRFLMCLGTFYVFRFICQVSNTIRLLYFHKIMTYSIYFFYVATVLFQVSIRVSLGIPRLLFNYCPLWKNKRFLLFWSCRMLCHQLLRILSNWLEENEQIFCNNMCNANLSNGVIKRTLFY